MGQDYTKRLLIPLEGQKDVSFFGIYSQALIATGYSRVIIGQRGPYLEFNSEQINLSEIDIPQEAKWRIENPNVFYLEYRSKQDNIKIYYQIKPVVYADYKPGLFYISPFDLTSDRYPELITRLEKQEKRNRKLF